MKDATELVMLAWGKTDEAERKAFVREHVHTFPIAELESAVIATLEERGWQVGLLMVALRILQVVPSERILHYLMAMISEGATFVPGGARLRPWLDGHVKGLVGKHPALAEAARRYRRPEWAKRPSERGAARTAKKPPAKKPPAKKPPAKKPPAKKPPAKKPPAKKPPAKKP